MMCFAQYIKEQIDKYYTFDDLVFEDHVSYVTHFKGAKKSRMLFNNGHQISVIFGKCFYSDGINSYEVAHIDNKNILHEPIGYLTKDQVTEEMIRIQKISTRQIFSKEDPYGEEDWET